MDKNKISESAKLIRSSRYLVVFTGAGISVESGIPPFRGKNGLWSKYDPDCLDLSSYFQNPVESWKIIREIFYDFFGQAKPNPAHEILAWLEKNGILKCIITQNIDNLHQEAGSNHVIEFHGTCKNLVCTKCKHIYAKEEIDLTASLPLCKACNALLKPDFIFFGEAIPEPAATISFDEAEKCDLMIVIGTTGEVMPACNIPYFAKKTGAKIIEINPEISEFTNSITDIYLQGKAGEIMTLLKEELMKIK